ncbi:unnamed protein product [Sphagnum balticum]
MNIYLVICVLCAVCTPSIVGGEDESRFTIQMPGYRPTQNDDYVCTMIKAPAAYISTWTHYFCRLAKIDLNARWPIVCIPAAFHPIANADRVHHMLLFGCDSTPERLAIRLCKSYESCVCPVANTRIAVRTVARHKPTARHHSAFCTHGHVMRPHFRCQKVWRTVWATRMTVHPTWCCKSTLPRHFKVTIVLFLLLLKPVYRRRVRL